MATEKKAPIVEPVAQVVEQKLSFKEYQARNQKGNLNLLLLGALKHYHGQEKHTESEWVELYGSVGNRTTS